MKRFENAEVGDKVYDELFEWRGIVQSIIGGCLTISFNFDGHNKTFISYDLSGYQHKHHKRPSLFYLDANGNKCTERPEQPIDWENVEPGTMFEVSNNESVWTSRNFRFFADGEPWFYESYSVITNPEKVATWNYIRRIK